MVTRTGLVSIALLALVASLAPAAEPKPDAGSLALLPKDSIGFVHVPSLRILEDDLKRFAKETGIQIGHGDHPALDILAARTGITKGIDLEGPATVGFMDPKKYRGHYTVYILPVADWDVLLASTQGEEMGPGLYALTGAAAPRYVARKGKFALVTSAFKTLEAVNGAEPMLPTLRPETVARAAGPGPMVYLNVHQLTGLYESEIASWFRAASGQVYNEPEAVAYADMLVAYMLGIADFLDQMETLEVGLKFGPDGLAADLSIRFVDGSSVANFLTAQTGGTAPILLPPGRVLTSSTTLRLDRKVRTDAILKMTRFFIEKAPRPQPLPEGTKEQVFQAVQTFAESLGDRMIFLSSPAAPGMGTETSVSIFDLKDPAEFRKGIDLMVAAWEALADQLNLYLKFQPSPEPAEVAGVQVTTYTPRYRFGVPARHLEFRERLREMYGPEGLVYRVAVVGDKAVVATGSDLSLFKEVIEQLRKPKPAEAPPALKQLEGHLPNKQQVSMAMSLPLFLGQALTSGGTPKEKLGTVDPGREMVGIDLVADGPTARVSSWWPYEQIRLTMDLLKRAAPDLAKEPESLFEPTPEGPPKPGPATPGAPPKTPPPGPATPAAPPKTPPPGPVKMPPMPGPKEPAAGEKQPAPAK